MIVEENEYEFIKRSFKSNDSLSSIRVSEAKSGRQWVSHDVFLIVVVFSFDHSIPLNFDILAFVKPEFDPVI